MMMTWIVFPSCRKLKDHVIQKVEEALQIQGVDLEEDDPEYQLTVECNALSLDIDNEILIIHNFIRHNYRFKFQELESLVHHPIDYARVVKKIGNQMDLTLVDLQGLLPSPIIMVVSVTASTTTGSKPLPEQVLNKTIEACDRALALHSAKKKVLDFVESRMGYIAPNVSTIVGSVVAAKLMAKAGGLSPLAKMLFYYIEQTEIFQTTPPSFRMRACRLLAEKSILAAQVDSIRGDPSGKTGRSLKDEIHKTIDKGLYQVPT